MENPKIGIFEEGTHRVVHIPNCAVHHPLINHVVREVRRCLVEHQIAPYSELAHLGCIRALQIVVERDSESAQLVIVTRDENVKLHALFASVQARLGHQLHSLWWNTNPDRTNTVLGSHFEKIAGPDTTLELLDGVAVHYPPGAFGQSNLPLFAELASRARSFIPDDVRVLELYAGTGALGLPLAHRIRSLEINEISAASLEGLSRGIEALDPEVRRRISVQPGPAAALANRVAHAQAVLVDPPRKGLDPELLDALLSSPPERLVYVSCNLSSFLTEADRLLASGAMKLVHLDLFALFPFTEHVETLAVFERLSCSNRAPTSPPSPSSA